MTRSVATLFVSLLLLGSLPALAQERGQYLPGFQGLNSGVQAPKGFTYANFLLSYPTETYKNAKGKSGPAEFALDLVVDMNVVAYTTGAKLLGGQVGMAAMVPVASTAVSLPRLDLGANAWGRGDIYVEPINLGWHLNRADIKAAYGFVAPTGKYDASGSDTTTTDYWGHDVTFNVTGYLTASKLTQV